MSIALASNSTAIEEVDRLFTHGADHAAERQALQIVESALIDSPADYQVLWRAARSYYYTGEGFKGKERQSLFERGIDAGNRAVARNADGVEGHFWLAAVYGAFLRDKGGLTAFRNVKKVRAGMETVLRLNPAYEDGTAYMALGEIDRQLPGLFGGNLKRGIAHLEQGLKIAPQNLEIKYSLAQCYLEAKRKEEARRQLQEALQLAPASPRAAPNRRAQENAQKLLAKIDKK